MSDRQKTVSRLLTDRDYRAAYIRAKLDVLIPSQLRALRLHEDKTQPELAELAGMKQSRISAMETPGVVNFNRETLVRMAATFGVGLIVEFVRFSEMLEWENGYSQDRFTVTRLSDDIDFLQGRPVRTGAAGRFRRRRRSAPRFEWLPQSPGGSSIDSLRIQQGHHLQGASQMNLSFEPHEQHPNTRQLAEIAKRISSAGSINYNLQNTATGAEPHANAA